MPVSISRVMNHVWSLSLSPFQFSSLNRKKKTSKHQPAFVLRQILTANPPSLLQCAGIRSVLFCSSRLTDDPADLRPMSALHRGCTKDVHTACN